MGWSTSIFNFLARARYNTVAPSPANGDQVEAQCDSAGRLIVALGQALFDASSRLRVTLEPASVSWYSGAFAASGTIKASSGRVHQVRVSNGGAAATYIRFSDGSTKLAPPQKLGIDETIVIDFPGGRPFSTSLIWECIVSNGSAPATDGAATVWVTSKYE